MNAWKKQIVWIGTLIVCISLKLIVSAQNDGTRKEQKIPEELQQLYAQSAVLMDADSGRILFEKNGDQVRAMASTTKIMTLILALEQADSEGIVEVSEYAASMPDVQLNINKGEHYRLLDLMYSLVLESHNDSAVAIAEHVASLNLNGTLEAAKRTKEDSKKLTAQFAGMMNAKARDIGCYDTHFVTPNGLDGEDEGGTHATTAADLARILRYCMMQSPMKDRFLEITGKAVHSFVELSGKRRFSLNNHNAFLQMMEGAVTGKTGFTNQAGYCYVGALEREGKTLIAALLACGWPNHKSYKWSDMRKLMNYGIENYAYYKFDEISLEPDVFLPIPVNGGQGEKLGDELFAEVVLWKEEKKENMTEGLLLSSDEEILVDWEKEQSLQAPIEAGDVVGRIQYTVGGHVFQTKLLLAADSIAAVSLTWCMKQVLLCYLL